MKKRNGLKKPFYKRPIFYIPVGLVVVGIIGAAVSGGGDEAPEAAETPVETVQETQVEETSEPAPVEATAKGLTPTSAQVACVNFGDQMAYPDNLKIHTIVGKKQEQVNDDEIRFLWDATLKSEAGGELKGEVLCVVSGTDDNPVIDTFEFR